MILTVPYPLNHPSARLAEEHAAARLRVRSLHPRRYLSLPRMATKLELPTERLIDFVSRSRQVHALCFDTDDLRLHPDGIRRYLFTGARAALARVLDEEAS